MSLFIAAGFRREEAGTGRTSTAIQPGIAQMWGNRAWRIAKPSAGCCTARAADTAEPTPSRTATRPGGEFFARPTGPNHRRYEALRGYLFEGLPLEQAAARAGYSPATLRSGAGLPGRQDRVLSHPAAGAYPGAGQERRPGADHRAAPGRSLRQGDRRGAGRDADPAQPHRGGRGARRGRVPPAAGPPAELSLIHI